MWLKFFVVVSTASKEIRKARTQREVFWLGLYEVCGGVSV